MLEQDLPLDCTISDSPIQQLLPSSGAQRFEGIAFSASGEMLGVAASDTDTVLLFRRRPDGKFDERPFWSITGRTSGLNYPHDLSFSHDSELLAVAQRRGSISLYAKDQSSGTFSTVPVFQIRGWKARLWFSDAVAFVPPDDMHLAALNLRTSSLNFYARETTSDMRFRISPAYRLKHKSLRQPDGLAFSDSGSWLAVANHGDHTVSIYARVTQFERIQYGPAATTVLRDSSLRYPHSVAFTPKSNHLVVTNAGANYLSLYSRDGQGWSQEPVLRRTIGPDAVFQQVNARNKREGGPKGIAICDTNLAVCSPEHGIQIYELSHTSDAS